MGLCPLDKCYYYGHESEKYPRKCYYGGPQCWKGYVDVLIALIKFRFKREAK